MVDDKESVEKPLTSAQTGVPDEPAADFDLFNIYETICKIASGGTATVWEALHKKSNQKVALKVLLPQLALETNFIKRFEQEAKIAASLSHDNIVQVYNHGICGNRHYIAMEFINGCSLDSLISRNTRFPRHIAAFICYSVGAALEYSHGRNVVHRDVKPGNILLSKNGSVKVTDFGFSRLLDGASTRLTQMNKVVGTPLFMSPEIILGKQASFSSDIFSLGIVLYILACGKAPFAGESMPAVMQKIMECSYVKPRKSDRSIPKNLERIIVGCLQKDPDRRFKDMGAVKDELGNCLGDFENDSLKKELSELVADGAP